MNMSEMLSLLDKKVNRKFTYLFAFLLPMFIIALVFAKIGIAPFGGRSILGADLMDTYYPFLSEFRNKLRDGDSLFYSWRVSGGSNFWAIIGYYLSSPLNLPILIIPERFLPESFALLVILRLALASLFMSLWVSSQFPKVRVGAVLAISLAYAFSGTMIAQLRTFMWQDAMILLPLLALGIWQIIHRKSAIVFVIALSLSLIGSFYTGFYNIFAISVLVPIIYLGAFEDGRIDSVLCALIRIALYTFLSIGIASVIILPTANAMVQTPAAKESITFWADFKTDFLFFDFMSRFLYKTTPEYLAHLPNVYCSVLVLLILPLFWANKLVRFSERFVATCSVLLMFFVMTGRPSDYIFNGLHFTQNSHYRYSYIVVFLMVFIAFRLLESFDGIKPGHLVVSSVGIAAYLMIYKQVNSEFNNDKVIYAAYAYVLAYAILMYLALRKPRFKSIAFSLLLTLMVFELYSSTLFSMKEMALSDTYINRKTIENTVITGPENASAVPENTLSHHVFDVGPTLLNPGALYQLNSVQGEHILIPESRTKLMEQLGIDAQQPDFGGPLSELFGVRYVVEAQEQIENSLFEIPLVSRTSQSYTNPDELPTMPYSWRWSEIGTGNLYALAIPEESSITSDENLSGPAFVNAFAEQLGLPGAYLELETDFLRAYNSTFSFENNTYNVTAAGRTELEFMPMLINPTQEVYVYVGSASYDVSVTVTDLYDQPISRRDVCNDASGIIRCGALADPLNTKMKVSIIIDEASPGRLDVQCAAANPIFPEALQLRNETHGARIINLGDRNIDLEFDASIQGAVVVFIPYDAGWHIESAGNTVKTRSAFGSLLAFELPQGVTSVHLEYTPPYFRAGAVMSIISVLAVLAVLFFDPWVLRNRSRRRKSKKSERLLGDELNHIYDIDSTSIPEQSEGSGHVNIGYEHIGE
ncbi:MAG: YfhO family protein [Clostridiaceae bacterium]|nr:YfhO family protein [Clostridiaceae bacterium]